MRVPSLIWFGLTPTPRRRTSLFPRGERHLLSISGGRVIHSRSPFTFSLSSHNLLHLAVSFPLSLCPDRGAGYTFGSGVVYKFLETNRMAHILRAHQLCMEGYASLFDGHLSTVWSAPNYCYRCGNSASILEVSPGEVMYFNVFQAAPENDRDGPSHQAIHNPGGTVRVQPTVHSPITNPDLSHSFRSTSCDDPVQYSVYLSHP